MKICKVCRIEKPIEGFPTFLTQLGGSSRRSTCRKCRALATKKSMNRNRRAVEHHRKVSAERGFRYNVQRYGISFEDYMGMLHVQKNLCAICHRPDPSGRRLCIDHNHETKEVRGLLCCVCNTAISLLEMDSSWPIKAKEYLNRKSLLTLSPKTKAYTREWREKVRQGNIKTWSDPKLIEQSRIFGRIGREKQLSAR